MKKLIAIFAAVALLGAGCTNELSDSAIVVRDLQLELPKDAELTTFEPDEPSYLVVGTTAMSPEEVARAWDPQIRSLGYDGAMEMRLLPKEVGDSAKTVYIDIDPTSGKKFIMGVRLLEAGSEFMLNRVGGEL